MGLFHKSADSALLARLVMQLPPARFVETGTYLGDGVEAALPFFTRIDTVEIDDELVTGAQSRFENDATVHVHKGTSPDVLARLRSAEPTVYWLDAHWYGSLRPNPPLTPLLDELASIGELSVQQVVLIDDARHFLSPPPAPHPIQGWPTLTEVLESLAAVGPSHELLVVDDVIVFAASPLIEDLRHFAHEHGRDPLSILGAAHGGSRKSVPRTNRPPAADATRALSEQLTDVQQSLAQIPELASQLEDVQRSQAQIPTLASQLADAQRSLADLNRQISALAVASAPTPPTNAMRNPLSALKQRVNRLNRLQHHEPRPLRLPASYWRQPAPRPAPTISIVTPSLNQGRFVGHTVASVLDQAYPALEYVVQDGGSEDETMGLLEPQRGRLHHLASVSDGGQAQALNRGFERTGGEIMCYLNSDDLLLPGSLAFVADYFRGNPNVDVLYGDRIMIDRFGEDIGRWVLPPHEDEILDWVDFVPQETLFWRRSAWEAAGSEIDESFRFAMDWDLLLRLRDSGSKIVHVRRFLGAFRIHNDQKTAALIESDGKPEMERIRTRIHGREPSQREILAAIRPYVWRHVVQDQLYRRRIRRS
ncbi:hypothetical protein BH10ACT11_BH10ACT11_12850 [soil metagenome]